VKVIAIDGCTDCLYYRLFVLVGGALMYRAYRRRRRHACDDLLGR